MQTTDSPEAITNSVSKNGIKGVVGVEVSLLSLMIGCSTTDVAGATLRQPFAAAISFEETKFLYAQVDVLRETSRCPQGKKSSMIKCGDGHTSKVALAIFPSM